MGRLHIQATRVKTLHNTLGVGRQGMEGLMKALHLHARLSCVTSAHTIITAAHRDSGVRLGRLSRNLNMVGSTPTTGDCRRRGTALHNLEGSLYVARTT